jgi:membrane-associated protease RseP (regulator of RpoE activity)
MEELEKTAEKNYTPLVANVLSIEDVTWGPPPEGEQLAGMDGKILVRFRGKLLVDPEVAYERLLSELRPLAVAPVFQFVGGQDGIFIIEDPYSKFVEKVFDINEMVWGNPPTENTTLRYRQELIVRYRGQLRADSEAAYQTLEKSMLPLNATPLFRQDETLQEVALARGVIEVRPSNPWINLILFILTVFSVLFSGAIFVYEGPSPENMIDLSRSILGNLASGIPFAVSLLAILLAHEFGHYLAGRYHRTPVTLPYFIPFPFSLLGTLGAFIQLKAPPKNKRSLLDIGAAGPLAGLVVAIPILLYGLSKSHLDNLPLFIPRSQALTLEGNSLIYLFAKFAVFKELLPAPLSFGGASPFIYWVRYFFTGTPVPLGGLDVIIDPIAWAGWAGLLVTAINLIPAGQLDGGHILYTLFGKKARAVWPFILVGLVVMGLAWNGWWLWAALIFFLGRFYAEPLDQITPLNRRRKAIAIFSLIVFFLVFIPVPLQLISGPG